MTTLDITAAISGEEAMSVYTGGRDRPSRDEIARLAYYFYELYGRREGNDLNDWLAAERELTHHYE
jgi:hypothetical protein